MKKEKKAARCGSNPDTFFLLPTPTGAAVSPMSPLFILLPPTPAFCLLNLFAPDSRPQFPPRPKNTAGLQKVLLRAREEQKVENTGKVRAGRTRPRLQHRSVLPSLTAFPGNTTCSLAPEKSPVWAGNTPAWSFYSTSRKSRCATHIPVQVSGRQVSASLTWARTGKELQTLRGMR